MIPNRPNTSDSRFSNYFRSKYQNAQKIIYEFDKNMSLNSFLGLNQTISNQLPSLKSQNLTIANIIPNSRIGSRAKNRGLTPTKNSLRNINFNYFSHINLDYLRKLNEILYKINGFLINFNEKRNFLNFFHEYWELQYELKEEECPFKDYADLWNQIIILEYIVLSITHFFSFELLYFNNKNAIFYLDKIHKIFKFVYQSFLSHCSFFLKYFPDKSLRRIVDLRLIIGQKAGFYANLKYNYKVIELFITDFLQIILQNKGLKNFPFIHTELFQILNSIFLFDRHGEFSLIEIRRIISKVLTDTMRPKGFCDKNNHLKEIFLNGHIKETKSDFDLDYEEEKRNSIKIPMLPLNLKSYTLFFEILAGLNIEKNKKRPLLEDFFSRISEFYEIVIFTILEISDVENTLNNIGIKKYISYILDKNNLNIYNNKGYKELIKTGRPAEKSIIIDISKENFILNQENVLLISVWDGDENDNSLEIIQKLLIEIGKKNFNDVRPVLQHYRDSSIRNLCLI